MTDKADELRTLCNICIAEGEDFYYEPASGLWLCSCVTCYVQKQLDDLEAEKK